MRVGAGFQVDVKGAALGAFSSLGEGFLLRMGLARSLVIPLACDLAFSVEHHSANHRIGAGTEVRTEGKFEGARRPVAGGNSFAVSSVPRAVYLNCPLKKRIKSLG